MAHSFYNPHGGKFEFSEGGVLFYGYLHSSGEKLVDVLLESRLVEIEKIRVTLN